MRIIITRTQKGEVALDCTINKVYTVNENGIFIDDVGDKRDLRYGGWLEDGWAVRLKMKDYIKLCTK